MPSKRRRHFLKPLGECAVCGAPVPFSDPSRPFYCRRLCFRVARVLTTGPEGPVYRNGDPRHPIPGTALSLREAVSMGRNWLLRWGTPAHAYHRAVAEGRIPAVEGVKPPKKRVSR
jgi:hypothetical protein